MKPVDKMWRAYANAMRLDDLSEARRKQLERAFKSGAASMFKNFTNFGEADDDEGAIAFMTDVHNALEGHVTTNAVLSETIKGKMN